MITDDEFAAWMRSDAGYPVVLAEFDFPFRDYVDGGSGDTVGAGTAYLANAPYRTGPDDTPASQPYHDCISAVPNYSRSIDSQTLGGRANVSFGSLELDNADGALDFLLKLAVDSRPVAFYYGDASWSRTDFRLMFSGTMQTVSAPSLEKIVIDISDKSTVLNKSVGGDVIGGTGPNAARSKPVLLGKCYQVECLLVDASDLQYQVADRGNFDGATVLVMDNVCDSGLPIGDGYQIADTSGGTISINTTSNVITNTGHEFIDEDIVYSSHNLVAGALVPASPAVPFWIVNKSGATFQLATTRAGSPIDFTSGTWTGSWTLTRTNVLPLGDGTFYISHSPLGQITANALMPAATGDSTYASDIIERLAVDLGGLDHDTEFAGAHSTFTPGDVEDFTLGIDIPEPRNIPDVLQDVMFSARAFYGFDRTGKFVFGRIRPGYLGNTDGFNPDDAAFTLGEDDFFAGTLKLTHVAPESYRTYTVIGNRNWSQVSSLAGGISAASIAMITAKGAYYRSSLDTSVDAAASYHQSLTDSPEIDSMLATALYADYASTLGANWVTATNATLDPWIEIVDIDSTIDNYTRELGDVGLFVMPRFNVTEKRVLGDLVADDRANQLFQVIGVNLRLTERRVGLSLVHKRPGNSLYRGAYDA
jgi:hypothetical protein